MRLEQESLWLVAVGTGVTGYHSDIESTNSPSHSSYNGDIHRIGEWETEQLFVFDVPS